MQGLDILIISPYDSEEIRTQMSRFSHMSNRVQLVTLPQEVKQYA